MSYILDPAAYQKMGPDGAEGEIGGSILSELLEGEHFLGMPDDYDFVYYLSRKTFDNGDYDGPVEVISIYKEGSADQRVFLIDYEQFSHDLDGLGESAEGWVERNAN